jgi:hypothetical protein
MQLPRLKGRLLFCLDLLYIDRCWIKRQGGGDDLMALDRRRHLVGDRLAPHRRHDRGNTTEGLSTRADRRRWWRAGFR